MTDLARQGKFAPLVGYESYVARIFQILLRQTNHKYNPLLLDSNQQRRLQVVSEVARQMATGDAPAPLSTWQVIALNYEALLASPLELPDNSFSDELQDKEPAREPNLALQALFLALHEAEGHIVLFVDHFHWLLGGERQRFPMDGAGLLVPALARREIQMVGACTFSHYQEHIERFAAIERRFQTVILQLDQENDV